MRGPLDRFASDLSRAEQHHSQGDEYPGVAEAFRRTFGHAPPRLQRLDGKTALDDMKEMRVLVDGSWVCNQCGSHEFTGAVSADSFEDDGMSCTSCGGTEFHWEAGPQSPAPKKP